MADRRILSQINVTPFVDVMLVLLVIFMITAPMMTAGIDVNLPKVEAGPLDAPEEPLIVTINKNGLIFVDSKNVEIKELGAKLTEIFKRRRDRVVFLKADNSVPYGRVANAMAEIRRSGIERIAMITEPLSAKEE